MGNIGFYNFLTGIKCNPTRLVSYFTHLPVKSLGDVSCMLAGTLIMASSPDLDVSKQENIENIIQYRERLPAPDKCRGFTPFVIQIFK